MQIDHVAIRVANVQVSLAFYRGLFGSTSASVLKEGSQFGRVDVVGVGDSACIELFEENHGFAGKDAPPIGLIHFAVNVGDVDAAYDRAIASGAVALRPPADVELAAKPGTFVRTAFVHGPSGEVVEFINSALIGKLSDL
jgi:catechol 2,3-dioxygenase-like lactoylglutathione lyase family enzyme